jgi:TraY domain
VTSKLVPARPGGPPKRKPKDGERVALSLRMTPALKRQLDAAAEKGGRSLSQEAEVRLERSFDHQDLLSEVLTIAYGKEMAGVLMFLGDTMLFADSYYQVESNRDRPIPSARYKGAWASSADAYDQCVQAALAVLEAMRPAGSANTRSDAGVEMASAIIAAVRNDPDAPENPFTEDAGTIRSLLGPIAERMTKQRNVDELAPLRLRRGEGVAAHELASAVNGAAIALIEFARERSEKEQVSIRSLPPEPLADMLEQRLKKFLAPGWRHRGKRYERKASGQLPAEARRRG